MEEQKNESKTLTALPQLLAEWDTKKNAPLDPNRITLGSSKRVWWICPNGHEYNQTVIKRSTRKYGCPYCSGKKVLNGFNDLQTLSPDIAQEWDYEKNDDLLPNQISLHSHKKVWWKCGICGNEWAAQINDRSRGRGCPVCSSKKRIETFRENTYLRRGQNDVESLRPDLAAEWDRSKNGDLLPSDFTCGSQRIVWWKCTVCGNEWRAQINNRAHKNSGCPKCMRYSRTSFPEQAILFYLLQLHPDAQNGYTELFKPRKLELDIYIPELKTGIEYDGKAWHSNKTAIKAAKEKYQICRENNIKLVRITETSEPTEKNCDVLFCRYALDDAGLDTVIRKLFFYLDQSLEEKVDINTNRDRGRILNQYIIAIKDKSISARYPEVLENWDYSKTAGITPAMVNANSLRKYWWKCKNGHSYSASASNVCINKTGCPVCSGRQVLSGYNDLATRFPEIAKEWDDEKNSPLSAADIMPGSQKNYWWRCTVGHSYQATPNARTSKQSGCPFCSGNKVLPGFNDLATLAPAVSQKWDYEKNGSLTPDVIAKGSTKAVWWKCENGHSWKKKVESQVLYDFCPICSGRKLVAGINDLSVTNPDIAEEWNSILNTPLTPQMVKKTDPKKVWWKCKTCGNEWKASIRQRTTTGSGCPQCGYERKSQESRKKNRKKQNKDLASLCPEIAKEWDYINNGDLDPSDFSVGSNQKVWWICPKGHHYQAWISDRTGKRRTGCPYCAGKRKLIEYECGE